jgi:hypothetical protein
MLVNERNVVKMPPGMIRAEPRSIRNRGDTALMRVDKIICRELSMNIQPPTISDRM